MLKIIECEQSSPEWYEARLGLVTASEFKTILGIKKDAREKVTRDVYMRKLAGEIICKTPTESYSNEHMERGKAMEDEARKFYSLMTDYKPTQVGFIVNGPKGCSPDSLIDVSGMLEVKTKLPHLTIDCLLKNEFPPEHKAQCQGGLWVAEREWIDIVVYWPRLPLFVKRAYRDEAYIKDLAQAVDRFNEELTVMVERIKNYVPAKEQKAA